MNQIWNQKGNKYIWRWGVSTQNTSPVKGFTITEAPRKGSLQQQDKSFKEQQKKIFQSFCNFTLLLQLKKKNQMNLWCHLLHPIFSSSILTSLIYNTVQPFRARTLTSSCQASGSVLTLSEILGKFKSSMPQFPDLYNGKTGNYLLHGVDVRIEIIHKRYLGKILNHGIHSININVILYVLNPC